MVSSSMGNPKLSHVCLIRRAVPWPKTQKARLKFLFRVTSEWLNRRFDGLVVGRRRIEQKLRRRFRSQTRRIGFFCIPVAVVGMCAEESEGQREKRETSNEICCSFDLGL